MFDPTTHSITEVLDYLDDADPVEIGRVLAVERCNRGRAEILAAFPASLGGRPPVP